MSRRKPERSYRNGRSRRVTVKITFYTSIFLLCTFSNAFIIFFVHFIHRGQTLHFSLIKTIFPKLRKSFGKLRKFSWDFPKNLLVRLRFVRILSSTFYHSCFFERKNLNGAFSSAEYFFRFSFSSAFRRLSDCF